MAGKRRLKLVIAVCAYRRDESLRRLLHSVQTLKIPFGVSCSFLLVDNAGSERTKKIFESIDLGMKVEYVHEPIPGVSNARNRVLSRVKADWILFVDDDMELLPETLIQYASAISRWPKASIFGGPIHTIPPAPNLTWQKPFYLDTSVMLGKRWRFVEGVLPDSEQPLMANALVRRSAIPAGLSFLSLGHVGAKRGFGEDTAFFSQLGKMGLESVWIPAAAIVHRVPMRDLRFGFLMNNYWAKGISAFVINGFPQSARYPRMSRRLFCALNIARDLVKSVYYLGYRRNVGAALVWAFSSLGKVSQLLASVSPSLQKVRAQVLEVRKNASCEVRRAG